MAARLTVGTLAKRAGVTSKTIRYYEAIGLLPPAVRGDNGYRYYSTEMIARLGFIRRAKALGLSLEEIGSVMALSDNGMCDVISPKLHQVLERKVEECDRQMSELAATRALLAAAATHLAPCAEESGVVGCGSCSAFESECHCLPTSHELLLQRTP